MKQKVLRIAGGHEVVLNSITSFPPGVLLLGSDICINLGCMSPLWVNDLVKFRGGKRLLRRILLGLMAKECMDDIFKEVEETTNC